MMIESQSGQLQYTTEFCDIFLLENGIVYYKAKVAATTLEQLEEELKILRKITNSHPCPFLSDMRMVASFPAEQRVFVQETFATIASSVAGVIKPGLSSFVTNIFLHLNRPDLPIRLFSNVSDAMNWLLLPQPGD